MSIANQLKITSTLIATGEITDAAGHIAAEDFRYYPAALDVGYGKGLVGISLSRERKSDEHTVLLSAQQRADGKAFIYSLAHAPGLRYARDTLWVLSLLSAKQKIFTPALSSLDA